MNRKEIQRRYRESHKEELTIKNKEYKEKNKKIISEKNKLYKQKNRERDKEKIAEHQKRYREKNKDSVALKKKKYYEENKEKIQKYFREYKKNRKDKDKLYFLKEKIRNIIYKSLTYKKSKNGNSEKILGCTFEEFKKYLENKFEPWMNWDNYGKYNGKPNYGWDIDHIISLETAVTDDEILKLNHYSNLQPLCSYVNRYVKKNKKLNNKL